MMDRCRSLWGRSPAEPVAFPLLALLPIVSSLTITSRSVPQEVGYGITIVAVVVVAAYGAVHPAVRLQVVTPFFVLLGGYWLGLLVHYYHAPETTVLQYLVVTPVTVFAMVVVLPPLIDARRRAFTRGLTLVAVGVAVIGFGMLWQEAQTSQSLYRHVGEPVLGIDGLQTRSVFANPNGYGFVMMVGSLAALYTALTRHSALWLGALGICLGGLLSSGGDASLLGFAVGAVVVLAGPARWGGYLGLGLAVVGGYVAIRTGYVGDVMNGTLLARVEQWVASLERLAEDPLLGIGFTDTAAEIGKEYGPHNSYIYPLLSTGLLAGGLYLGALGYALGRGLRSRWTAWGGFVIGLTVAIFVHMGFESLFLGGLSVSSLMLGCCLGLLLYTPAAAESSADGYSKVTFR